MIPIDFQWIAECDSTSRVLKDNLSFADNKLRALAAAKQTNGVGRLGRRWISAEGNLYFSIAIPGPLIPEDIKDIIPISAGVLVAQFIRAMFDVNVCLKWPNDLLLDGKKIGGILCEATILDGQVQGVIIGVGLNIARAPEHCADLDYLAGDLGRPPLTDQGTVEGLARNLAMWFAERWQMLSKPFVMEGWDFFAMTKGSLWIRKVQETTEWYRMDGLDKDGYLSMATLRDGTPLIIKSSNNELKWDLQMNRRLMVADIGNTRTKVATVVIESDGTCHLDGIASDAEGIELFVKAKLENGFAPLIHCLSVSPVGLKALEDRVRPLGVDVLTIEKRPIRLTRSNYDFESLGADRWAILEMLYFLKSQGHVSWPAVVVSCGTATTIDCVDSHGVHVGGFIMAGVQTAIDAITERGALLPKSLNAFDNSKTDGWPTGSNLAIIDASIGSTAAFIQHERERLASMAATSAGSVPVLVTGGYSSLVSSQMRAPGVTVEENLVLFGAALIALNGR